jgi:hypothetical protein
MNRFSRHQKTSGKVKTPVGIMDEAAVEEEAGYREEEKF